MNDGLKTKELFPGRQAGLVVDWRQIIVIPYGTPIVDSIESHLTPPSQTREFHVEAVNNSVIKCVVRICFEREESVCKQNMDFHPLQDIFYQRFWRETWEYI